MLDNKKYYRGYYIKNRKNLLEQAKKYNRKNRKKTLEYKKQYHIKNKKKILDYAKEYRKNNQEKIKKYKEKYYKKNKEKILEQNKEYAGQYRENNRKKIRELNRQYSKIHREEITKRMNRYQKYRRKIDLRFKLNTSMSVIISNSLKGNKAGRHWETLVGYTLNDLIKRLKKTMPKGYTWQDYLEGKLHIDHKIPKNAFNFTKPEHIDFKRCWALKNLRLLPAEENLIKGSKLSKPFQPALKISFIS